VSAAVRAGPLESAPGGLVPAEERSAFLAGVMDGVELGAWDRRVADWLAGLDTSTALTIAAWIQHSPAGARRRLAREQRHSPGQR
jgi:hypothetical protein